MTTGDVVLYSLFALPLIIALYFACAIIGAFIRKQSQPKLRERKASTPRAPM